MQLAKNLFSVPLTFDFRLFFYLNICYKSLNFRYLSILFIVFICEIVILNI